LTWSRETNKEVQVTNVSQIGNTTSGSTSTSSAAGQLTTDEFLRILLSEVQNQNPLEPMKNNELMAQMTQIKSLEATTSLVDQLNRLTDGMNLGSAASLIGKLVAGTSAEGVEVTGKVQGLVLNNGEVNLVIDGQPLLPVSNVEEVAEDTVEDQADDE
jgi:flagellar basal-body rod modification protein FlgD